MRLLYTGARGSLVPDAGLENGLENGLKFEFEEAISMGEGYTT